MPGMSPSRQQRQAHSRRKWVNRGPQRQASTRRSRPLKEAVDWVRDEGLGTDDGEGVNYGILERRR